MNEVHHNKISSQETDQRLDNYLIRILKGVPKSHIYRIIRAGEVRVNKKRAQGSTRLQAGDIVRIPPVRTSAEKTIRVNDTFRKLLLESIIHEDSGLLVINKPSGLAVHGGSGLSLGVIEALRHLRTDLHYLELVHRLDRDTSGCLLLAKKRSVLKQLQAMLAERTLKKTYWTLSAGRWQDKTSVQIDVPLQKNSLKSGERIVRVDPAGKPSLTKFRLLENFDDACWVEASPETGRTHQIRVHSAYLGHPILGDEKYQLSGTATYISGIEKRLYLHAREVQFVLDGKKYRFVAKLDARFEEAFAVLRQEVKPNE